MPEGTINQAVMTPYEIIATVLAVIALVQPWILAAWKKFFKPLKVSFIPSAKIKLYYNRSGAYIYLGGVIEAKNRPAVIKDISAKVIRQCDKAELTMDWSSFMVPVFQSVGGNSITTSEIARPFIDRLIKIYEKLILESKRISNTNTPFEQAKDQLQAIPEYQSFREELLENFYWKVSDYQIELSISHSDNKTEVYRYQFSLTQDEVSEFKKNIDVSMLCELSLLYYQPTNFTVFQKAFNPLEG